MLLVLSCIFKGIPRDPVSGIESKRNPLGERAVNPSGRFMVALVIFRARGSTCDVSQVASCAPNATLSIESKREFREHEGERATHL